MTKDLKKGKPLGPKSVTGEVLTIGKIPKGTSPPVSMDIKTLAPSATNSIIKLNVSGTEYEVTHTGALLGSGGASEAGWSQIQAGIGCMKEFQFRYIRGLREPQAATPDHFAIGSQVHAGRARWFAKGFGTDAATWASIQDAMRKAMEEEKLPVSIRALQMGERYMDEYIRHWARMPKPTPVACEYKLGPTHLEKGDPFFMWRTTRLDDVSKYPEALNGLCLGEAKTASASPNDVINQYTLHGQVLLQQVLWKMDPNGEAKYGPIKGTMLDIIQKSYDAKPSKFARHFMPTPPWAMTWFVRNLKQYMRGLAGIDWDTDAPRNISRCTRIEGKARITCEFRDLCMSGRSATAKYVMGKGESLMSWRPAPGKMTPPWE